MAKLYVRTQVICCSLDWQAHLLDPGQSPAQACVLDWQTLVLTQRPWPSRPAPPAGLFAISGTPAEAALAAWRLALPAHEAPSCRDQARERPRPRLLKHRRDYDETWDLIPASAWAPVWTLSHVKVRLDMITQVHV